MALEKQLEEKADVLTDAEELRQDFHSKLEALDELVNDAGDNLQEPVVHVPGSKYKNDVSDISSEIQPYSCNLNLGDVLLECLSYWFVLLEHFRKLCGQPVSVVSICAYAAVKLISYLKGSKSYFSMLCD